MNPNDFTNAASEFQGISEGLHSITPDTIKRAKEAFSKPVTGFETQAQVAQMEIKQLVKSIDQLMYCYDQMQVALGFPSHYGEYTRP